MNFLAKGIFLVILLALFQPGFAKVIYVNGDVESSGDGASWQTSYKTVQEALDSSVDGDEIWIAAGEYNFFSTGPYTLKKDVSLFGGFEGNENYLWERDFEENRTILSCDESGIEDLLFNIGENQKTLSLVFDGLEFTKAVGIIDHFGYGGNYSRASSECQTYFKNCQIYGFDSEFLSFTGNVFIENCQISNNSRGISGNYVVFSILNSEFFSNSGELLDLYISNEVRIFNSDFIENVDGSLTFGYGLNSNDKNVRLILSDCIFSNNINTDISSQLKINVVKNIEFINNNSSKPILEIENNSKELIVDNCTFEKDTVNSLIKGDRIDLVQLNNLTVKNNHFANSSIDLSFLGKGDISNCIFVNNTESDRFYHFFLNMDGSALNLENVVFSGNKGSGVIRTAGNLGGYPKSITLKGVEVVKSTSQDLFDILSTSINFYNVLVDSCDYQIGKLTASDITLNEFNISDSKVQTNIINNTGSGKTKVNLNKCNFTNIKAGDKVLSFGMNDVQIKNSRFTSNTGSNVLYLSSSSLTLENSDFSKNSSINSGGVISMSSQGGDSLNIKDSRFIDNNSKKRGGVIFTYLPCYISDSYFKNNSGSEGGVIYTSRNINVSSSYFENNSASNGGVFVLSSDGLSVFNSHFIDNKAYHTAAIVNAGSSTLDFFNCDFIGNHAAKYTISHFGGNLNADNCVFLENIATEGGFFYTGLTEIRNSVFCRNVQLIYDKFNIYGNIYNSIIYNNQPHGLLTSETREVLYSNIEGGYEGEGNLNLDPKFIDPENGDFRLSCESPLINKGANQYLRTETDFEGKPRIVEGAVDMGPYELAQPLSVANAIPNPSIQVLNPAPCKGEEVSFINTTENSEYFDLEFGFKDSTWFFSRLDTVKYTFEKAGIYTVKLKATNACGLSDSTLVEVKVKGFYSPDIRYRATVCPGDTTAFFTTSTSCADYDWQVNGGSLVSGAGTSEVEIEWGSGANGNGQISLAATSCGNPDVCEVPAQLEVPIFPSTIDITGDTVVCHSSILEYQTAVRDFIPGAVYRWSVKGGTISGSNKGYELDSVSIKWSETDTLGVIYLDISHEMLDCSVSDSLVVNIRPAFKITADVENCVNSEKEFQVSKDGKFTWAIGGEENTVEDTSGKVTFGTQEGSYFVYATSLEENKFCKTSDSLKVYVNSRPVIDSVTGAKEVSKNPSYPYNGYYSGIESEVNWYPLNKNYSSYTGQTKWQTWRDNLPYGFKVVAVTKKGSCPSDTVIYEVKPDFVYTISGPDTLCVNSVQEYIANEDPQNPSDYTWKLNGVTVDSNRNSSEILFTDGGLNTISIDVVRKGRHYSATKEVFIRSLDSSLFLTGPTIISPKGGGTYSYILKKPFGYTVNYFVEGATSHSLEDSVLTVTWSETGPYKIAAYGTIAEDTCSSELVSLSVQKASVLSDNIDIHSGNVCLNSEAVFTIETDSHTKNIQWSLSGGGAITGVNESKASVNWGNKPGTYELTVIFDRLGPDTLKRIINLGDLPSPQIADIVVCGGSTAPLTTLNPYSSYKWTLQPSDSLISNEPVADIAKGGTYKVDVVDASGCSGSSIKYIRYVPQPKVKAMAESHSFCQSDNANRTVELSTLEGRNYSFQWYKNDQPLINDTNSTYSGTLNVSGTSRNEYKVIVVSEGCVNQDSVNIVVRDCEGGGGGPGDGDPCGENIDFSVSGCQPFAVTNLSSPSDGFTWNFGDGHTSDDYEPIAHSYGDVGTYTITLRYGQCSPETKEVEVPVFARFTLPTEVCEGDTAEITDYSVNLPHSNIQKRIWDFGDNSSPTETSSDEVVKHVFSAPGTYVVSLTVEGENKEGFLCSHTTTSTIEVIPAPKVDFDVVEPSCNSTLYSFKNLSTQNTTDALYSWSLGENFSSGRKDASAWYSSYGLKTVSLEVTDYLGCKNNTSKTFTVNPPVEAGSITVNGTTDICWGDSVLLTAPLSDESVYRWKKNGEFIGVTNRAVYAKERGNYSVEYIESGCRLETGSVNVTPFAFENASISFLTPKCFDDKLIMSLSGVSSDYSVTWQKDGEIIENVSEPVYNINVLNAIHEGIYTAIVKDNNSSCTFTLPDQELVGNSKPVTPVLSSDNLEICQLETASVIYTNPFTNSSVSWFKGNTPFGKDNVDTLTIDSLTSGINISAQVTDKVTGCVSNKSGGLYIRVAPKYNLKLTGDIEECEREDASVSTTLSNDPHFKPRHIFSWYQNNTLLVDSVNRVDFESLAMSDTGTFYAVATSTSSSSVPGCDYYSDTITIKVKNTPEVPVVLGADEFCSGDTVILVSSVTENIKWNTESTNDSIFVSKPGSYAVTVTDTASGCQAQGALSVQENPLPDLRFISPGYYTKCGNQPLAFNGLDNYLDYQWKLNGQNYGRKSSPLFPRHSGKYTVHAVTSKGCEAESDTMRIISEACACVVMTTKDSIDIGSLRDAINCANDKPGPDYIHFLLPGEGPFRIKIDSALPVIEEAVIIDGFSQSGSGIYDIIIDTGDYNGSAFVFDYSVEESEIRGLQFENFKNSILVNPGGSNNLIEENKFLGKTDQAVVIKGLGENNTVRDNYFESDGAGEGLNISLVSSSTIANNTFKNYKNAVVVTRSSDLILESNIIEGVSDNAIVLAASDNNTIKENSFISVDSSAILVNSSSDNIITKNRIGITKEGVAGPVGKHGVNIQKSDSTFVNQNTIVGIGGNGVNESLSSYTVVAANKIGTDGNTINGVSGNGIYGSYGLVISDNTITHSGEKAVVVSGNSLVFNNTIKDNSTGGVYVVDDSVKISENIFTNSNSDIKAIDLHGEANQNKQAAEFTSHKLSQEKIEITGTATPGDSVEIFLSENRKQQALKFVERVLADENGEWALSIPEGDFYNPDTRNYYVNTATGNHQTSELSDFLESGCYNCECIVLNLDNAGEGSLRAVVDSAHAGVCRIINFDVVPGPINLESPLRKIEVPVVVNGLDSIVVKGLDAGTGFDVWANDVQLSNLDFEGWEEGISLKAENAQISDIAISKTSKPVTISGNNNSLTGACINCNASEDNRFFVEKAIVVSGNNNEIGSQEKPNSIVDATETGVEVNSGTGNSVLYTTITGPKTAIKHLNEGNNNYPSPTELESVENEDGTATLSGSAKPGDKVQVFLSNVTGKPATKMVAEIVTDSEEWSVDISKDFVKTNENTFFITTATSPEGNTSEFSEVFKVGDNAMYCLVTNTLNEGDGSLRAAVNCANEAGQGTGAPAYIVFDLPASEENQINVLDSGFVVTNNYGVTVDPENTPVKIQGATKLPYAFYWESKGFNVKNLSFSNFETSLKSKNGNNASVSNNTFTETDTAIAYSGPGQVDVKQNHILSGLAGIFVENGRAVINGNTIGNDTSESVTGYGIILNNATSSTVDANIFRNIGGAPESEISSEVVGKGLVVSGGGYQVVVNNIFTAKDNSVSSTVKLSDINDATISSNTVSNGQIGIEIDSCEKLDLKSNRFNAIQTNAIDLFASLGVEMSDNLATDLAEGAKPIHLYYQTPDVSNNGILEPVFEYATYKNGYLIIRGKTGPENKVEIFTTDNEGRDLKSLEATVTADRFGKFEYVKSVNSENINDKTFRATATIAGIYIVGNDGNLYTSEASTPFNPNLKICTVTKESDDYVKGTFRYNLHLANKNECNLMLFNVENVATVNIAPDSAFPVVTAKNLTIDATSQPGYDSTPNVNVNNSNGFSHALQIDKAGDISVHGLGIRGFDEALILDSVNNFESSLSAYEYFTKQAIAFNAKEVNSLLLHKNHFVSSDAPVALSIKTPRVTATENFISAGNRNAVEVLADDVVLIQNIIDYPAAEENAFAITALGMDSLYADNNQVSGYTNGFYANEVKNLILLNNAFDTTGAPYKNAVLVNNSDRPKVLGSKIPYADTAVVVRNSFKPEVSGNHIQSVINFGVWMSKSDSSIISSNTVSSSVCGIVLDSALHSRIEGNIVFKHDSAGVVIDSLSDYAILASNNIGAPSLSTPVYSVGAGILINSSNNIIGETDSTGNTVMNNFRGGVIVNKGTGNRITYNTFVENDSVVTRPHHLAIDHINDGNNLKAKPEIVTYTKTDPKGVYLIEGTAEAGDSVHIYRSEGYYQNTRYYMGVAKADVSGDWSFTLDTTDLDVFKRKLKYGTITLVATATDADNNTSELSDIFYLGDCYILTNQDNRDNEYPYPNSFRQAVACANSQPQKAVITFAIDGASGFDIPLRKEMISFVNPYGVDFNGANVRNFERPVKVFNAGTEGDPISRFWFIADSAGHSSFENFRVQNFDTAVYLGSKQGADFAAFEFLNIQDAAFVLADSARDYTFDSLAIDDSEKGGLLKLASNNINVELNNSEIKNALYGLTADSADTVSVFGSTFEVCQKPLRFNSSKSINIENNTFELDSIPNAITVQYSEGLIYKNTFNDKDTSFATTFIYAGTSKNLRIVENSFPEINDICIEFNRVDSALISGNYFGSILTHAVLFDSTRSTLVNKNKVKDLDSLATACFDLHNSDSVFLSENLVSKVNSHTSKLINLNKGEDFVSNQAKPEPVIKGYKVQLVGECSETNHLGIYLYGNSEPGDSIEVFISDTLYTSFEKFIGATKASEEGQWEILVKKEYYERDPEHLYSFTATGTDTTNNTSQEAEVHRFDNVENKIVVTNTADEGAFTLRAAINEINCSDIFSRVYFEIEENAPFEIVLQDTLPEINAYLGFSMDGQTQADFNAANGITDLDSTIYVIGSSYPRYSVFTIHEETDSSRMANMVIRDAASAIKVFNSSNRLHDLKIEHTEGPESGDTAIVISGAGGNIVSNTEIKGYSRGINLIKEASGNNIEDNDFRNVTVGVTIEEKSNKNRIRKNSFNFDSLGVYITGTDKINFVRRNTFGSIEEPIYATAVKLQNAASQYIENNYFPAARRPNQDSTLAFIALGDSAHNNIVSSNKIGVDPDGFTNFTSDFVGIQVKPDSEGEVLSGNVITANQIAGLEMPGIELTGAEGGSVQGNFIGVDSAFVQRQNREGYDMVSGMDTTAIVVDTSVYVTINSNTIVNFAGYALDVRSSDNISISANKMFSERSKLKAITLNLDTDFASNQSIQAPIVDTNDVIGSDKIVIRGTVEYPLAKVQIFEGFSYNDDTLDHALRFIKTVDADENGNWEVELPSSNFGFNKYNKYIAQVTNDNKSSEFSAIYTIKSLLCKLTDRGIDLLDPEFTPCPKSNFEVDAVLSGLNYEWTAENIDTIWTKTARIDSSAEVTLKISDDFGCEHSETFNVVYKSKPIEPEFIVASTNYVGDTIVLVDVATPVPTSYDWSSSDAITIVSSGDLDSLIKGPDGKNYPKGREVRFIVPDTGEYTIEQRSLRNGCFVKLTKTVSAEYKDPTIPDPYSLTPGVNDLVVYPSPVSQGEITNAYISTASKDLVEVEVVDMQGVVKWQTWVYGKENYNVPLETNNIGPGTYLVRLTTNTTSLSYKIVVK